MSNSKTPVTIEIKDALGELEVVDGQYQVVQRGFGSLQARLDPGIYKVRAQAIDAVQEHLFVVDPESGPIDIHLGALEFSSPLSLQTSPDTAALDQDLIAHARISQPATLPSGPGGLLLSLQLPATAQPVTHLHVYDLADVHLVDIDEHLRHAPGESVALLDLSIAPGNYQLCHQPPDDDPVVMPLTIVKDWKTCCFLQTARSGGTSQAADRLDLSDRAVLLVPLAETPLSRVSQLRMTEIARHALAQGKRLPDTAQIAPLLEDTSTNPMLGLLLAHALLLKKKPPRVLLAIAIEHLEQVFGADFPDVLALRMALAELQGRKFPLPATAVKHPPLLLSSWNILARHPDFWRGDYALRAVAMRTIRQGVWLAWEKEHTGDMKIPRFIQVLNTIGLNLEALANRFNAYALQSWEEAQEALGGRTGRALELLLRLAMNVPWRELGERARTEAVQHDAFTRLSPLQRTLIPTLQLLAERLAEGEEFSAEDLEDLCKGLKVPLPVLYDSLKDLAHTFLQAGVEALNPPDE